MPFTSPEFAAFCMACVTCDVTLSAAALARTEAGDVATPGGGPGLAVVTPVSFVVSGTWKKYNCKEIERRNWVVIDFIVCLYL